jgi:hypothetical protein
LNHSHSIYVLGTDPVSDDSQRKIFDKILQHLFEGYAVIYVGDEDESKIIQYFQNNGGQQIEDYIKRGLLTIINRDVFYSPFVPTNTLLGQWTKLFTSIEKKAGKENFKGFVAIGMLAESFFISDLDNQQLVRYESLAAKKYDGRSDAICIYTTQMLQKLPLRHVISLLNAHQNTGHRESKLREWNIKRGLSILNLGLDSALGANVAELVLAMLIRDFEMNEDALILHPDKLEKKLEILLGSSAAELVTDQIKLELTKDIVY